MDQVIKNGIYEHYKGNRYKLIDIVKHSETLEDLVLYETIYENKLGKLWVRPKEMFFGNLENGEKRFKFISS